MDGDNTLRLARGDDLRMMTTPDAWPHSTAQLALLPIKRREDGELGVLISAPSVNRTTVFLTNMFDERLRSNEASIPTMTYASFEAIARDWIVD